MSRLPARDRAILRLAVPALGALAADPLVSLVDTAFVGRLGADALGSLAIAAAVFGVAFGLFNFLAYGTTPIVARALARGDDREAGRVATAGGVLGAALGVGVALVIVATGPGLLEVMGASADTAPGALTYLRIRAIALPAVMLVTVGHGVFRGLQDTRTPLLVTLGLNAVNLVLDPLFIFGLGWGLAGAAWATVVAQWIGALWFVRLLTAAKGEVRAAVALPQRRDVAMLLGAGRALVLRTGSLLAVLTLATAVAARIGTAEVAAHQVVFQLWFFLSLVLDALAIAAQALVGKHLTSDVVETERISRRLLLYGFALGWLVAAVIAVLYPWLPGWFSSDAEVVASLRSVYWFLVFMQPLNALVFVWDGIVIGATDFAYLAWTMAASGAASAAGLITVGLMGWGLPAVWWAIAVLMLGRAVSQAWWHRYGPFAAARGPFPSSQEA